MREFVLEDGGLVLRSGAEKIVPTADEIFRSVIEGEDVWPGEVAGTKKLPHGFQFSRYPAVPELLLEPGGLGKPPVLKLSYYSGSAVLGGLPEFGKNVDHFVANNTWYPIDSNVTAEVFKILGDCGAKPGRISSIREFIALKKLASEGAPIRDLTAGECVPPMVFVGEKKNRPEGINAKLYGFQLDGWRWLQFTAAEGIGGLLADEMGLGKTLQIISVLSDPGGEKLLPALVVAPGSLLENWRREIDRFAPGLSVLKHHGTFRTGRPAELTESDIIVTSYETVVRDSSMFRMVSWGAIVADEAQYIKNPDARRTKAIKQLDRKVAFAVTGTPVENSLADLWSILDFTTPGYLGELADFVRKYSDVSTDAADLEPLVSPLLLRRRIAEVAADLPPRIDVPQVIELGEEEASEYNRIRLKIIEQYGKSASLVSLSVLRMFCCHPQLVEQKFPTKNGFESTAEFSKFQRLGEILEEIFLSSGKVLIFTSFTAMADLITEYVRHRFGLVAGKIDGRVAIDLRQQVIDRFSEVEGAAALVLNPKAGGTGLNITAANHVIHYNLEWNPAVEDQASARSHRRGQTRPVTVHRLITASSVEEVIDRRMTRKRRVSEAAVVGVTGQDEDYADIIEALQISPLAGITEQEEAG